MISINLSSKTALITGASQGLGAATARRLHQAGANVVINYWPDPESQNQRRADELVEELGENAIAIPADVRDEHAVDGMFTQIKEQLGSIDFVVNNAGIVRDRTVLKMTSEESQQVIDTN